MAVVPPLHQGTAVDGGGGSTTRSITLTSTTAGNLLVLGVMVYTSVSAGGGNGTIVTPPAGWTLQAGSPVAFTGPVNAFPHLYMYYILSDAGGRTSASVVVDNTNDSTVMWYAEYSGTAGVLDSIANTTQTGNSTTIASNTSYATTNPTALLVCIGGSVVQSSVSSGPTGGYTSEGTTSQINNGDSIQELLTRADVTETSAGTFNTSWGIATSKFWATIIQAFDIAPVVSGAGTNDFVEIPDSGEGGASTSFVGVGGG